MSNNRIFTALFCLFFAGAVFSAETYQVDATHSAVTFSVRHFVINKVRGNFKQFSGTILYDEGDMTKSSVTLSISTASINTQNEKRDNHLRSEDFFDAEKFPDIIFKSKRIVKKGDGYSAVGDFTMHGVTKEISIPFEITGKIKDPWGKTRIGIEATLKLNRQDYGVSWSQTMDNGGLVVSDEVKIEFNIEAVK